MKFTYWFLVVAMLIFLVVSTGCFPAVTPEDPEPDPEPITSADIYGLAWDNDQACCYIENTGDVNIDIYQLVFDVDLYGHVNLELIVDGTDLEVGGIAKECVEIFCPVCEAEEYIVESVSVNYKLWDVVQK